MNKQTDDYRPQGILPEAFTNTIPKFLDAASPQDWPILHTHKWVECHLAVDKYHREHGYPKELPDWPSCRWGLAFFDRRFLLSVYYAPPYDGGVVEDLAKRMQAHHTDYGNSYHPIHMERNNLHVKSLYDYMVYRHRYRLNPVDEMLLDASYIIDLEVATYPILHPILLALPPATDDNASAVVTWDL